MPVNFVFWIHDRVTVWLYGQPHCPASPNGDLTKLRKIIFIIFFYFYADKARADDKVTWEFKWENVDEAKVYGPHSTLEMQKWVDDGYFADGVWVRRSDQPEAQFYTSKRVDFDLYL